MKKMKRFEYVCTACGRPFGRKFVANRHLANVHGGQGAITSTMDYMLGAFNGTYAWPRLPQNKKGPSAASQQRIEYFIDFFDRIHKITQFQKDYHALQDQLYPPVKKDAPPLGEFLIANVCAKCCSREAYSIANLYDVPSICEIHQCEPERIASVEKADDHESLFRQGTKGLPAFLKFVVDDWLRGDKYLYAQEIPAEFFGAISQRINKSNVNISVLKKFARENDHPHYLQRAVEQAKTNNWTALTNGELSQMIDHARATCEVVTIVDDESNTPAHVYLIALVPPHRIREKRHKEEVKNLMKEFGLEPSFFNGHNG
jgi:hypothetical protein